MYRYVAGTAYPAISLPAQFAVFYHERVQVSPNLRPVVIRVLAFLLFAIAVSAAPVCTDTTMAALMAQGSCDYAGVSFSNWSYSINYNGSIVNSDPNPTDVNVTFATLPNSEVVVEFSVSNGSWTLTGTGSGASADITTADIRPGYNVQLLDPSDPNSDEDVYGISAVGQGAEANVTWDYTGSPRNTAVYRAHGGFADDIAPMNGGTQVNPSLDIGISPNPGPNGPGVAKPTDLCVVSTSTPGASIATPCSLDPANIGLASFGSLVPGFIDGPKDISISSGAGSANEFQLTKLDEVFSEVTGPEPQTYILIGAGLLLIVGIGRNQTDCNRKSETA